MKKLMPILIAIMLFGGCNYSALSEEVELNLEASDTEIILGEGNEYHKNVEFTWSLNNNSLQTIASDDFELNLASAEPGALSSTILQKFEFTAESGTEANGTYAHLFDSIGVEGNYEFQLILFEKDGEFFNEIKKISIPYSIYWE